MSNEGNLRAIDPLDEGYSDWVTKSSPPPARLLPGKRKPILLHHKSRSEIIVIDCSKSVWRNIT